MNPGRGRGQIGGGRTTLVAHVLDYLTRYEERYQLDVRLVGGRG